MAATEDAFTHIRRASEEEIMAKKKSLMDPKGASEVSQNLCIFVNVKKLL